jgi:hypothetical protein
MRCYLGGLGAIALAGCSLLYNPSNITPPLKDAPAPDVGPGDGPEMLVDADPTHPTIATVDPSAVAEGTGDDPGSREALLVITGTNFVPGATVTVAAKNGTDDAKIVVDTANVVVSADNHFIAVPLVAHVGATSNAQPCATATPVAMPLTITVMQNGASVSFDWTLACLPKLTGTNASLPTTAPNVFSSVALTGTLSAADTTNPLIVRATSTISIGGNIAASATNATQGPGGQAGPGAGLSGTGPGFGGGGSTTSGAGGAGFAGKGGDGGGATNGGMSTGEPLVSSYTTNLGSSGGGGDGAAGGAGGGTIELTAGGKLSVHGIAANGGNGGGGVTSGGGGAGGVILLRGTTVTLGGALTVTGGSPGSFVTANGGAGASGRIRVDAQATSGTVPAGAHIGIAFDANQPYVTRATMVPLALHGTQNDVFDLYNLDAHDSVRNEVDNVSLANAGATVMAPVHWGFNRVCLVPHVVPKASVAALEGRTCLDVAFLP